ncbi:CCC motif membrane protein [Aureisphaera galaxeae]|uniref:CCC motif membrane protein n=1 Tax=Aureisphaera galaxeae TaxID=1538023 RepID=UPI002351036B|nr:CCC motif membrane protein [Aureisphaera galaxeae]MDC8004402.1 CCC motif membrane protein [Aureisphaera galaxeae]
MEKQKLPNSTLILVFGIISIVTCCCYGVLGLIFAIIALVMAKKATALYMENPEQYSGFQNVKTGKILAYIGLVLNILYLGYVIWLFATLGSEGIMNMNQELLEKYGM